MRDEEPPQTELTTWQEIAEHLGVSVRTAQKYEKVAALPVRRMPGPKGRVLAYRADLDNWRANLFTPAAPDNGEPIKELEGLHSDRQMFASEDISTYSREGGPPAITATQVAPRASRTRSPRALMASAGIGALVVVVVIGVRYPYHRGVPVAYRTEVSTLITLDGEGREVWRHQFPEPLYEEAYKTVADRESHGIVADLDGQNEMLFRYVPETSKQSRELICFSQTGKEKWRFASDRADIIGADGEKYLPPYWVNGMLILKNPGARESRIVVSSNHHFDAPDQVAVLDSSGKLVGEFWHPGHLRQMLRADLNHDGKEELLLAGVNNAYHAATLLLFDPERVHGSSNVRDAPSPEFGLQGFAPGTEKAILLFPRTCLSRHKAFNRVANAVVRGGRIYVQVSEDTDEKSLDVIIYTLDFSFNVLAADPLPQYQETHRQKYRTGELDHELTGQEMEGWKKAVVIKRR